MLDFLWDVETKLVKVKRAGFASVILFSGQDFMFAAETD